MFPRSFDHTGFVTVRNIGRVTSELCLISHVKCCPLVIDGLWNARAAKAATWLIVQLLSVLSDFLSKAPINSLTEHPRLPSMPSDGLSALEAFASRQAFNPTGSQDNSRSAPRSMLKLRPQQCAHKLVERVQSRFGTNLSNLPFFSVLFIWAIVLNPRSGKKMLLVTKCLPQKFENRQRD